MSDFGTPMHTLRHWLGNDVVAYGEVLRIAETWTTAPEREWELRQLVMGVLFSPNAAAAYRKLWAQTPGTRPYAEMNATRKEVQSEVPPGVVARLDWSELATDVMEGM